MGGQGVTAKGLDIVVISEVNPDLVITFTGDSIPFGQVETLLEGARLTVGGSGTIFACGAARLGLRTAVVGLVGDDVFGQFMISELDRRGVLTDGIRRSPQVATGVTVVIDRSGRDRAILTYPGAMSLLGSKDLDNSLLEEARHVHVSSIFLQRGIQEGLPSLLARVRASGGTTSLDPNWDPYGKWSVTLEPLLDVLDVLLPNENEAMALTGCATPLEAVAALAQSVPQVVLKRGAKGAVEASNGKLISVAAPTGARVADTTGAGDSFDGGYLYGYLSGRPSEDRLRLAVACGSLSTRTAGGTTSQATLAEAQTLANRLAAYAESPDIPGSSPGESS